MQTISVAEARGRLDELIDRVVADADYTLITRGEDTGAVVMSLASFNGLMETVHLLRSPANALHLARSIEQYRRGEVEERPLLDDQAAGMDRGGLVPLSLLPCVSLA